MPRVRKSWAFFRSKVAGFASRVISVVEVRSRVSRRAEKRWVRWLAESMEGVPPPR